MVSCHSQVIKTLQLISLVTGLVFFCSSCATITKGRYQDIFISSTPLDAKLTIDEVNIKAKTPAVVNLKKNHGHTVKIEKEGYKGLEIQIVKSEYLSNAIMGNIIFSVFGFFGLIIDILTGAAYKLEPKTIDVTLQSLEETT